MLKSWLIAFEADALCGSIPAYSGTGKSGDFPKLSQAEIPGIYVRRMTRGDSRTRKQVTHRSAENPREQQDQKQRHENRHALTSLVAGVVTARKRKRHSKATAALLYSGGAAADFLYPACSPGYRFDDRNRRFR